MSEEFEGLTAIVTGGASGIGNATAKLLRSRGARVAVLDLNVDGLDEGLTGFQADVSSRESVEAAVAAVAEWAGGIDILVNNAGISAIGNVEEANDDAEWARVFNINVFGIARVSAAALQWLKKSASGAIVNVCSVAALNGMPSRAIYGATKGAVLSLTFSMATDYIRQVRVNCVSPGTADTPFVSGYLKKYDDPEAERKALDARQPIGRMVSADEVANAIAFLASPLSASTTGSELVVDGGLTHLRVRPQQS